MKKIRKFTSVVLTGACVLSLVGCIQINLPGSVSSSPAQPEPTPANSVAQAVPPVESEPVAEPSIPASSADVSEGTAQKAFGTYTIPEGWFESGELSTDEKFFYLKDGTSLAIPTSNISVSVGTNKYGADEFLEFAQAIDRQLKSQVTADGTDDVTGYFSDGSYTDNGYPLITMTIEFDERRIIQHYIMGDHRYVMVYVTDFGDEQIPDVEEAAREIVKSFVWSE